MADKNEKTEKNSNLYELTKGLIKQNPTLVGLLGMCPTLAVTTMAKNGIGMGLATTFVLVCSNLVISLLKNVIPKAVRLPCFIVVIAGFVTLIEFLMKGYIPDLYNALGVFLSLITVNCIILGRAEAFASKNKVLPSILDGLGMGLGFTLSLFTMGSVREILGTGSWMGLQIPVLCDHPMTIFIMPAGGFFVLGCLIALVNKIANKKPPQEISCSSCPNAAICCGQCKTDAEEGK
ncbi:electron transport complex subunit E [uncultured Ruminococcus sp.]|uniref:electron transport complex subunit RsxE n=1 Tax=uncultured Ruminococcus sp. TaxID=165186 RepID=UPI0025E43C0F|nr:electron transport complex subunit E [uncultured Ruminococcus sp.]